VHRNIPLDVNEKAIDLPEPYQPTEPIEAAGLNAEIPTMPADHHLAQYLLLWPFEHFTKDLSDFGILLKKNLQAVAQSFIYAFCNGFPDLGRHRRAHIVQLSVSSFLSAPILSTCIKEALSLSSFI
jgi:hypothetical protein